MIIVKVIILALGVGIGLSYIAIGTKKGAGEGFAFDAKALFKNLFVKTNMKFSELPSINLIVEGIMALLITLMLYYLFF